ASGWLQAPDAPHPPGTVGSYTIGWHRFLFDFRVGETQLDPTRYTVAGRVEYLGRRFDFRSGRVRFGDAIGDDIEVIRKMVAEARAIQDTSLDVIVEVTRTFRRKEVAVRAEGRSGSRSITGWVQEQLVDLAVTLRRRSRDGA